MSKINVNDKTITTSRVVKSVEIESNQIVLNESAKFMVRMLDEDGRLIGIETVELTGDDYSNWGSEDNYVVDFILNKLGLTEL